MTASMDEVMVAIRELGERMECRFEQVDRRFEQMDQKFDKKFELIQAQLLGVSEQVAEVKGRLYDMPTARDFGHIEGRIDQIARPAPARTPPQLNRKKPA